MSYISAIELAYQAGTKTLFDGLSFHINPGDRIGLVGDNGSGKSTLLSLISRRNTPDAGRLSFQRGLSIGLVEQFLDPALESMTPLEAVVESIDPEHRAAESYRVETLLDALGFDAATRSRETSRLSGGQKNLVAFARAIIRDPELLLLDEPGNHMDSRALYFLHRYLSRETVPSFIMISHDRDLLDGVTQQTLWLRDQRCYSFPLSYTGARQALAELDEANEKTRAEEEKKIGQLKASAKRLAIWGREYDNKKLARKAKSMEKRIDKLESDVTFVSEGSTLSLEVDAELLRSKQLFVIDHEQICAPDDTPLFSVGELFFKPGDRVALLGDNGVGKSSCIKTLLAHFNKGTGAQQTIRFNPNVKIGYFDQELAHFESNLSMMDWVSNHCHCDDELVRRTLINWGFAYLDHSRSVNVLSGGERARLLLLTFQLDQPNLLIMDEPTNHIDLQGKEQLEIDLTKNGVSLLFTSHDRRFIENTATRFWWVHEGVMTEILDPGEYFDRITSLDFATAGEEHSSASTSQSQVSQQLEEEQVLERMCELESLIEQDLARKPKFQKPAKQEAWRTELACLNGWLNEQSSA